MATSVYCCCHSDGAFLLIFARRDVARPEERVVTAAVGEVRAKRRPLFRVELS